MIRIILRCSRIPSARSGQFQPHSASRTNSAPSLRGRAVERQSGAPKTPTGGGRNATCPRGDIRQCMLFTRGQDKGDRLDSRPRESRMNQLLTSESNHLRCSSFRKMREHAHYFRVFCGERGNRGLLGGAQSIRTLRRLRTRRYIRGPRE
jgi:hypothetical protein